MPSIIGGKNSHLFEHSPGTSPRSGGNSSKRKGGWFIVRVQLDDPEEGDYDELHDLMERSGFSKEISDNGAQLKLPDAEYFIDVQLSLNQVIGAAKDAVDEMGAKASILASEVARLSHFNLDKVH